MGGEWLTAGPASRSVPARAQGRWGRRRFLPGVDALERRQLLSAGDLDATFASWAAVPGELLLPGPANPGASAVTVSAMAVQRDGKMVAAGTIKPAAGGSGDVVVVRLDAYGHLDPTFDGDGFQVIDLGGDDQAAALAIEPDGRIVVGGSEVATTSKFAVARLNPDGSLDSTFNQGKVYTFSFGAAGQDHLTSLAIQPDGKIVVAGTHQLASGDLAFAVARLTPTGSLDPGFGDSGGGGTEVVSFTTNDTTSDAAEALAIQPDGRIVVAGSSTLVSSKDENMAVIRLTAIGTLDKTFGTVGLTSIVFDEGAHQQKPALPNIAQATAVAVQADGRVVLGGYAWRGGANDFAIARLTTAGVLDTTFSGGGERTVAFDLSSLPIANVGDGHALAPAEADAAASLALGTDGTILLAGSATRGGASGFGVVRLDSSGWIDPTYNVNGQKYLTFAPVATGATASAVAVMADGRAVVAGTGTVGGVGEFAVARLLGSSTPLSPADGTLDTSFGGLGTGTATVAYDLVDPRNPTGPGAYKNDTATATAVQPDGKVIVVGSAQQYGSAGYNLDFAITRLNADGTLDTTFNKTGKQTVAFDLGGTSADIATAVVLQTVGSVVKKIVVVGTADRGTGHSFAIARLNPDGSLDTTFDNSGLRSFTFNPDGTGDDLARAVALSADGTIIVGGSSQGAGGTEFAVARLNSDGTPDASFGAGVGKELYALGTQGFAAATGVVIQADGKVLVAGTVQVSATASEAAVIRLLADGSLDPSFGNQGEAIFPLSAAPALADGVAGLALGTDGTIVVAGTAGGNAVVARLTSSGTVDPTFAGPGQPAVAFRFTTAGAGDAAAGVAVLADGSVVVSGTTHVPDFPTQRAVGFARLTAGATAYQVAVSQVICFDSGGIAESVGGGLAIQSNGEVVIAGATHGPLLKGWDMAVARVLDATAPAVVTPGTPTVVPPTVPTTSGAIDPTFGTAGRKNVVVDSTADLARTAGTVVQPDGKILIAGTTWHDPVNVANADFTVVRLNADGSLDTTFNGTGIRTIAFDLGGTDNDIATGIALQPDGRIVVVGSADRGGGNLDFAIVRLTASGTLDTTFDGTGKQTVAFDLGGVDADRAAGVVVQPDGKLVVAGTAQGPTSDDFAVARLNADGSLDTTFNGSGKQTVAFDLGGDRNDVASGVALETVGQNLDIVVVGAVRTASLDTDIGIARLNPDGSPDASFGGNGRTTVAFNLGGDDNDTGAAIVAQPDGKLVVVGTASVAPFGNCVFAVARVKLDGTLDGSFTSNIGVAGERTITFEGGGPSHDVATAVTLQPDGKIVVAGAAAVTSYGNADVAAARLDGDGSVDTTFNGNGLQTVAFDLGGSNIDVAAGVAIQPDGNLIVAGTGQREGYTHADLISTRLIGGPAFPTPAAVTSLSAQALSGTQIALSWTGPADPNSTGYEIDISSDGTNFTRLGGTFLGTTSFVATGLIANTSYSFEVRATGPGGLSTPTAPVQVATPAPPAAPTGLAVAATLGTEVVFSWEPATGSVSGYDVEISTDGKTFTLWNSTTASVTSVTIDGLTSGSSYYFRVRATGIGGDSSYASTPKVTTPAPPSAPTIVSATALSGTTIQLTISNISLAAAPITQFGIERADNGGSFVQVGMIDYDASNSSHTYTYTSTGLTPGGYYRFQVRDWGPGGTSDYSLESDVSTPLPPPVPTSLTATTLSGTKIQLAWTEPAGAANLSGFRVEVSADLNSYTTLGTFGPDVTSTTATGLSPNHTYGFRVYATGTGGDSTTYAQAQATTLPPPPAPAGLTVVGVTATTAQLSWTETPAANITGFVVERSSDGNLFQAVGVVSGTATSYTATWLVPGQRYAFRVYLTGPDGRSPASGVVWATTPLPPAPTNLVASAIRGTSLQLTWTEDPSAQVTSYGVEQSTDNTNFTVVGYTLAGTTTFQVTSLTAGQTYEFRVRLFGSLGISPYSATVTVTPPVPQPPTNFTAVAAGTGTSAQLSWSSSSSSSDTTFVIQRSSDGTKFSTIGSTVAPTRTYTATGLSPGVTYLFRVYATGPDGTTAPSNVARADMPIPPSPRVIALKKVQSRKGLSAITLTFSVAMDATSAQTVVNYSLVQLSQAKRGALPTVTKIALTSATLSSDGKSVLLLIATPIASRNNLMIDVSGSLLGAQGGLLEGGIKPGTDYIQQFFPY